VAYCIPLRFGEIVIEDTSWLVDSRTEGKSRMINDVSNMALLRIMV
jgi:hypothetical protein